VKNVVINVSHVQILLKLVLSVLETESIYTIAIVQLDIMKLLIKLIVQLVKILVKNVQAMKLAQNVKAITIYLVKNV